MANPEALMLWEEMRKDVKNKLCVECGANNPQWASVSYGTIFCLECSGVHRSLGVHISFVRSLTMDQWSQEQLKKMKVGGNRKFAEFFEAHGVPAHYSIKEKYHTEVAQIYKDKISALSSGREWRDPPVGSLSTVPVLPQARVISSSSGPAAGSQDSQSSAPPSSRYGGMGNFTPKPSNNSSSDSEWSALLGSSWGAISAITSTAAAKTQELAQIAAEKIQVGTTDISSKVQTTDWSSVKQNLVSSSQSTWSTFSSFLSSATESLTHLAKEVTLSEEEVRKQQGQGQGQGKGQGISASVVPSDTFGDWEIPDDLSPPPPSSLKSSGSSSKAPASPASSLSSSSPSSSPASKPDTKAKGAWSKEAYAQGWSSSDADKGSKEKPAKTVTKTSSSGSGSKDGWDNWDAGWEDEEDEDDVPKKKAASETDSSAKASAPVDASGWSDPSWDSNWDNAD